jgi:hypothetical protein
MRGKSATAALLVALLTLATGCSTAGQRSTQPSPESTSAATSTTATAAARCHPASPITLWRSFLPMAQGTGHGATLWGLLMFPHPLPARVGDQEKIVWRMTGTGPLTLTAFDPAGMNHQPAWGPATHLSGEWDKPGDEWGAGYVFTQPGCWDLRASRGRATADVWLNVIRR